jgi:hypothetical protein
VPLRHQRVDHPRADKFAAAADDQQVHASLVLHARTFVNFVNLFV